MQNSSKSIGKRLDMLLTLWFEIWITSFYIFLKKNIFKNIFIHTLLIKNIFSFFSNTNQWIPNLNNNNNNNAKVTDFGAWFGPFITLDIPVRRDREDEDGPHYLYDVLYRSLLDVRSMYVKRSVSYFYPKHGHTRP